MTRLNKRACIYIQRMLSVKKKRRRRKSILGLLLNVKYFRHHEHDGERQDGELCK